MNSKKIGDKGEDEAVQYLRANGYAIIERNWRWKRCEIDIIAKYGGELIFIEVKTRKNEEFGYPEEFLSEEQEDRIHLAAEEYCDRNQWRGERRFDIISILMNAYPNHLEHLEGVF